MLTRNQDIEAILRRVDETLQTAWHGFDDLVGSNVHRRMTGLRNLIVFGRAVTFVLQNLRGVLDGEFDRWYEPRRQAMNNSPLMRFFIDARNKLEKQGKLDVATSVQFTSMDASDLAKFGNPPPGSIGFFVGDRLGGTGWDVKLPNGMVEKYYVDLPSEIGSVTLHFIGFPATDFTEFPSATINDLTRLYLEHLTTLVTEARVQFLK